MKKLHDKQKEIIQSPKRFKTVRAGRRGGKTIMEVEDMVFEAVNNEVAPIFYIAPTQIQARAIIWEELKARTHGFGEPHEQRLEMKIPNKFGGFNLIKIAGWENRENFRGQKAWKIYFDEVDTMKDFFIGWQEIFRPALTDLKGQAMFSGTPKNENRNLRRLEKMAENNSEWGCFHFTTADNPHIDPEEIQKAHDELDFDTFKQEYLAEYNDNQGSLFSYDAVVDVFTNTITKDDAKYLIIDIADDGSDNTIFSFWEGLEEYKREAFNRLNSESIIAKTREYAAKERIPYSNIACDAIGVGSSVASSSYLDGIVGFKSSYAPIKTDISPVELPNIRYTGEVKLTTDYKNLRCQCVFILAQHVNNHLIASRVTGDLKEKVIEELPIYQDVSKGDGKRMATLKKDVKEVLKRSPDNSDTWIMRMYFVIREKMNPVQSEEQARVQSVQQNMFVRNGNRQVDNSTK